MLISQADVFLPILFAKKNVGGDYRSGEIGFKSSLLVFAKKLLIQSKQMKLHLRLVLLNKEIVEKLPKNLLMISSWVQPAPLNRNRLSFQFCKQMELRKLRYSLKELIVIIYLCTHPEVKRGLVKQGTLHVYPRVTDEVLKSIVFCWDGHKHLFS